jgi:diguanylate cyclase (GGDEF)-like protein
VLSVLMFDVDHFKNFNDSYGHATGDAVLTTVAARCRRCLREVDVLGRYGGEVFAVVLVGTGLEPRIPAAERLRAAIADKRFDTPQGELGVSISLGIAERRHGEALEAVLERADQALFAAKAGGRNRVEAAT